MWLCRFGHTQADERTALTIGASGSTRYVVLLKELVHLCDVGLYALTQLWREGDVFSAPCSAIIDGSIWYVDAPLLFQADGLCCQLYSVDVAVFGLTVLVLYGKWSPIAGICGMGNSIIGRIAGVQFDEVCHAVEPQSLGGDADSAQTEGVALLLTIERVVHMLVHDASFGRQEIFIPLLLNVDKCPLPGTKRIVLYPREHEHIVFGVGHQMSSSTVTPSGTLSLSMLTE